MIYYNWVINGLLFSIAPMTYVVYNLYKDNKKKDHIIELQDNILKDYWKIKEEQKIINPNNN